MSAPRDGPTVAPMDPVDAIGVLADSHVRLLLLHDRGLPLQEIADRMGVPEASVPNLLRVARAKLAELEA